MRLKKTLQTGSTLELGYTSFKNCMELMELIATIIRIDIPDFKFDSEMLKNKEVWGDAIKSFIPIFLNAVIKKDDVLQVLFDCADQSLINGQRINMEYFEEPENRKDFFIVLKEVLTYNIQAFLPMAVIK